MAIATDTAAVPRPATAPAGVRALVASPMADQYLVTFAVTILCSIGAMMVLSASSVLAQDQGRSPYYYATRQMIFMVVGVGFCPISPTPGSTALTVSSFVNSQAEGHLSNSKAPEEWVGRSRSIGLPLWSGWETTSIGSAPPLLSAEVDWPPPQAERLTRAAPAAAAVNARERRSEFN